MFRKLVVYASSFSLIATSVMATSGQVTANLNFRTEPGTGSPIILTIPDGSAVEILDCDEAGSWCALEFRGQTGFASGRYVIETEPGSDTAFPRSFGLEGDAFVVLYEPQFSAWTDFQQLYALVAAEFRSSEEAEPVFGVIGLGANTTAVSDDRTVVASNMRVTQLDFAALDRDQLASLSVGVGGLLPTDPIKLAEERILAGLSNYQSVADVEGMKAEPPVILISYGPSRLVQTDGPAIFASVENTPDVEFVVNTNWDILRVDDVLWLRDQASWLRAPAIEGAWTVADALPEALQNLPDNGNWDDARAAQPPALYDNGAPEFLYSDEPAEIIVFDGPAEYERVPGTDLRWASNTESDLFQLLSTGTYYFLVSGRWFSSASLDGPWEFATPDLPSDFQRIPDDMPYYTVRASIPGTSEANEARLRASIPELAQVTLNEFESPSITYDGDPTFAPIEGTEMAYATNTAAQVIQVGERYYMVIDGIWFVSESPEGPWDPSTKIPDEIYEIPPSSPMHNATYVRVYETTPATVTYGYTPGYFWSFLAWGAVIYGTGWRYNNFWGDNYYPPGYYRPPPVTYGGGAYYNPARGTYGRYGYANGPYRGVEARTAYDPATGSFARGRKVYGPDGSRGFVHASNPRTGTTAVARGRDGVYGKWGAGGVKRGSDYARVRAGEGAAGGKGVKWDSSRGSGFAVSGRRGNTYAGRDGNVYRKTGDSWQKWDPSSGWEGVQRPSRDQLRQQSESLQTRESAQQRLREPANRPQAGQRQGSSQRQNAGARVPNQVQRDAEARSRANQRSHEARQPRSPAASQRSQNASSNRYGTTPSRTPTRSAPQRSYSSRPSAGASYHGSRTGGRSRGGRRR